MAPNSNTRGAVGRKMAQLVAKRIKETQRSLEPKSKKSGRGIKRKESPTNKETAITDNSKRQATSHESEPSVVVDEPEVTNMTGGLKLLKRETVTMGWLANAIIRGKQMHIKYNKHGDPIGKEFGWLQSYIGVLARTRISISYKDWRQVPQDEKEKLWDSVTTLFVLSPSQKKEVLVSAATKWRNFKSVLTSKYIMPYKDNVEVLKKVPDDYRFLKMEDWHQFVSDRLTNQHMEVRQVQISKRQKNKYNHRMSRKGYRGIRVEMTSDLSTDEVQKISRHTYWIKGRQDKKGGYKDSEVEEAVKKILKMEKDEAGGAFKATGTNDVLTEALGNPEHSGRVRGVGAVKPVVFFKLPRQKRGRKKKAEELQDLLAKEREKWEEEMQKKHDEEMKKLHEMYQQELKKSEEKISQKLERMEIIVSKGMTNGASPVGAPTNFNAKSGEGSCNREDHDNREEILGNYEAVAKKKLVLLEVSNSIEEEDVADGAGHDKPIISEDKVLDIDLEVALSVEESGKIVAYGTFLQSDIDPEKQTIHGRQLGKDNYKVEIVSFNDGAARLPYPIKGEMEVVKEAIGSIVAWPKVLCTVKSVEESSKEAKKFEKALKKVDIDFHVVDFVTLPPNLPRPLRKLCEWARSNMRGGKCINNTFGPELFGAERYQMLMASDLYAMAHLHELTAGTLTYYMSHLYQVLKKADMHEKVLFVDPCTTYGIGTKKTPTDRSKDLMDRFKQGGANSIFLIPYNSGSHWTLTVVDIAKQKSYWLDPLKRRLPNSTEWTDVVSNGLKFYYAQKEPKKVTKTKLKMIPLLGVPEQRDDKTCGFWVMMFMREIVMDKDLQFVEKWINKCGLTYNQSDVDEVRTEWAEHVLQLQ